MVAEPVSYSPKLKGDNLSSGSRDMLHYELVEDVTALFSSENDDEQTTLEEGQRMLDYYAADYDDYPTQRFVKAHGVEELKEMNKEQKSTYANKIDPSRSVIYINLTLKKPINTNGCIKKQKNDGQYFLHRSLIFSFLLILQQPISR